MTKDNGKAYRKVRIAVHEVIDEAEATEESEWTVYSTSFVRHKVQKDGSMVRDEGVLTDPPVSMFLSALINTLASVVSDEFEGEEAMKIAASLMGHFMSAVADGSGISIAAIGIGRLPDDDSNEGFVAGLLGDDSDLTEEQKEQLKLSMQSINVKKGLDS